MAADLRRQVRALDLKGTLIVATEGVNGTVAGSRDAIDAFRDWLDVDGRFIHRIENRWEAPRVPFQRALVKLKDEIVTMRAGAVDVTHNVGEHIPPHEWNDLIADPNTIVVDTRNDYEVGFGTFARAINPHTESFHDFPAFVEHNLAAHKGKRIAMFCTGGVRCEKATAYLREQGFGNVLHLQGGILNYLQNVSSEESLWEGDCFVFDERIAVSQGDQTD